MYYGYARVSTFAQNLDRQLDELVKIGIDNSHIYTDKESGKDFNRTNYRKLCRKLKAGDVLFIKSIDRLGRNYDMIIEEWTNITKNIKSDIVVMDMPLLDTREKNDNYISGKVDAKVIVNTYSLVGDSIS